MGKAVEFSGDAGSHDLPAYAGMMADYHAAFEPELREVVAAAGVRPGDLVIDVACGDGSYARWLAEHAGDVLAVDVSPDFLGVASRAVGETVPHGRVRFVLMDLERSPLVEGTADFVWCAQSLYSLPDPVKAVRRMSRLAKDEGRIAVFESDELHHVILPWPVEVELALRKAELDAYEARSDRPAKFYIARELPRVFREAGLPRCDIRSFAFNRRPPFDVSTRRFVTAYLADLRSRIAPHLPSAIGKQFDEMVSPASPHFILDDPDALVVCVDHLAISPRRGA